MYSDKVIYFFFERKTKEKDNLGHLVRSKDTTAVDLEGLKMVRHCVRWPSLLSP
jgi:hypothetical protein